MEKLKYVIEDKTISELLGIQNFSKKESAILEIVKNAFDAKASELNLEFKANEIIISDNGVGMDSNDIKNYWMHIGKSNKDYSVFDKNNKKRILAGSKGIGRFALARLGEEIEVLSKKNNALGIIWKTNWNESILDKKQLNEEGTKFIIKHPRDNWTIKSLENLTNYLSKTYNDSSMKISLKKGDKKFHVKQYFREIILGFDCHHIIKINYDSKKMHLNINIISDEFKEEASKYLEEINFKRKFESVDIKEEFNNFSEIDLTQKELEKHLTNLGDFSGTIYFARTYKNTQSEMEKFLYKYDKLPNDFNKGVILYRNAFSLSSYEGTIDWLHFGRRSRQSPAAATHPTGSWKVRENNIFGQINIDKKENFVLKDLSNRQGLEENTYYLLFIELIVKGISVFERYRQEIIRQINKKNKDHFTEDEKTKKITDDILKNPSLLKNLKKADVKNVINEIKVYKKDRNFYRKELQNKENKYKYDVRILNVLATSGLKSTSLAHEMNNSRSNLDNICDYIIKALKSYNLWEFLNEKSQTRFQFKNIPKLIEKNRTINEKTSLFIQTLLESIEKKQFFIENYNILDILIKFKTQWEKDYSWIKINLVINNDIILKTSFDVFKVIFDNLILNSVQQNSFMNNLEINIQIKKEKENNLLNITYSDNGIGLPKKYKDSPKKILEVHESSRKDGHGLGMWIVNNTILMSHGKIETIESNNGFKIEFMLGEF